MKCGEGDLGEYEGHWRGPVYGARAVKKKCGRILWNGTCRIDLIMNNTRKLEIYISGRYGFDPSTTSEWKCTLYPVEGTVFHSTSKIRKKYIQVDTSGRGYSRASNYSTEM